VISIEELIQRILLKYMISVLTSSMKTTPMLVFASTISGDEEMSEEELKELVEKAYMFPLPVKRIYVDGNRIVAEIGADGESEASD